MKIIEPQLCKSSENAPPMTDVVFLLLIFFMLSGTLKRPEPLEVNIPIASQAQELQPEKFLLLINAEGQVALNQKKISIEALHQAASLYRDAWQTTGLQVKADAQLDAHLLLDAVEILASQGISNVFLMADNTPD